MNTTLFNCTPTVSVLDNRGLAVRDIAWLRHPETLTLTDERITRHSYDARGFLTQSADSRLHDAGLANFTYLTDLAGGVLRSQSADAGVTLTLNDAAGRPVLALSNIAISDAGTEDRSQALSRRWQYEDATLPGRPLSVTEQLTGEAACITERFVYAGNSGSEKAFNLAGRCVRHFDSVGQLLTSSIALTDGPLSETRYLLKDADNPDTVADWQGTDVFVWERLLENVGHTTLTTADATGAVLTTTDARGNMQRVAYDVAGLLSGSWLTLKGGTEQVIVASLTYSAAGQKLREVHGSGVVTTYTYEPETQRLTGIKTARPAGHPSGAKVLQDLRYEYDPVGNVLKITNDAEQTRFWRNQKVVPENTYVYDSLYQLVKATGREMANSNPSQPTFVTFDNATYTPYQRSYAYDRGGNLTQIRHSATATNNSYTTDITVSDRSNRALFSTLTQKPAEVDAQFTAGGQQKTLQPGQQLAWTPRGELLRVSSKADDAESYRYDAASQRISKTGSQKTASGSQRQRVLYLPGLELRTKTANGAETENLQVVTLGETGRAQVRALHWTRGKPAELNADSLRYSYDTLIGSGSLELDGDGNLISMEEYYPYGGTALWSGRNQTEADYKTRRYSGKERDASGLYYYGYRYYQPWAGRWLSADPAGTVDGLNLFRMVRNNPLTLRDNDGLAPGIQGHLYAPFITSEHLDQSLGINVNRHLKGKSLYPVIVANDEAMLSMHKIQLARIEELTKQINNYADAVQKLDNIQKDENDWTPETLRASVTPEQFDKNMQSTANLAQDLAVLQRIEFTSNSGGLALGQLHPERDKLYIIAHGGAGADILAAQPDREQGVITTDKLASDLAEGGLTKSFKDIRIASCFSADTTKPTSFERKALAAAVAPITEWHGYFPPRRRLVKASFAQLLRNSLSRLGYSKVAVSGYHASGVTYSANEHHARRLPGHSDARSSKVRHTFR